MEEMEQSEIVYQTRIDGEKGVIVVDGDLANEQAGEALRKAFNQVFNTGTKTIVMDLSKVQIINSYGIGKILMYYKRLKADGCVLMVKPLSGFVKDTFELLMLDSLFPVDND